MVCRTRSPPLLTCRLGGASGGGSGPSGGGSGPSGGGSGVGGAQGAKRIKTLQPNAQNNVTVRPPSGEQILEQGFECVTAAVRAHRKLADPRMRSLAQLAQVTQLAPGPKTTASWISHN